MSALREAPLSIDLPAEIDALLRRGATDPRRIADRLLPRLTPEQLAEFAREWVAHLARLRMGVHRRGPLVTEERKESGAVVYTLNTDRFAMARADLGDDGWAKYSMLTAAECIAAAEYRERLAAGNMAHARRFRSLASAIKRHGVERVGELPESVLAEILK